jgi:hypothetical protein
MQIDNANQNRLPSLRFALAACQASPVYNGRRLTGEPPSPDPTAERAVGLCARCRHARRSANARGSAFWQCLLAQSDRRFVRYPRLPVRACPGYAAAQDAPREEAP